MSRADADRRASGPGCGPSAAVDAAPAPAEVVQVHRLGEQQVACWRRSGGPACRRGTRGSARPRSAATARSRPASGSTASRPNRSVNTSSVRKVIWEIMPGQGQAGVGAVAGRGVVVVAAAPLRVERDGLAARCSSRRSAGRWPPAQVAMGDERRRPGRGTSRPTRAPACRPSSRRRRWPSGRCRGASASRAWVRTMSRIGHHREARAVAAGAGRGAATPGRSCPGSRRARWRTRRTSGRCRAPGPGRSARPTSPASGGPGPARPGGVGVAGEGVADEDGVAGVGVELAPGLVGDGDVARAGRRPRARRARSTAVRRNWRSPAGSPGRQAPVTGQRAGVGPRSTPAWASTESTSATVADATGRSRRCRCRSWSRLLRDRGADARVPRAGRTRTLRCRRKPATSPPEAGGTLGVRPRLPDPVAPGHS